MLQNLWLSRVKRRRRGSLMELHLLRTRQHLVLTLQDDFTNVSCRIMTIMANSKSYEPLIRCICILSQKPQRVISAEDGDRGLTAALWVEESKKRLFARDVYLQVQRPDQGRPYGREKQQLRDRKNVDPWDWGQHLEPVAYFETEKKRHENSTLCPPFLKI
jgi:hypothetical protein